MLSVKTKMVSLSALALSALSLSAFAAPATHVIVAPHCLLKQSGADVNIIAANKALALAEITNSNIEKLSDAKHRSKTLCGGFIDVTTEYQSSKNSEAFLASYSSSPKKSLSAGKSYSIRYEKDVNKLISQLNPQLMWDSLTTFSSSKDRFADSNLGVAAANWIKSQVEAMAKSAGRDDVTVYFIQTAGHKQPSVVAKLGNGTGAGVVIGAHMDTTQSSFGSKPGADDDGSGSMTVMESARTIITSGATFKKPVYFIWYSAEELGLVGSRNVVAEFKKKNIPVDAVMHFDMTGFAYQNEKTIWLIDDNVDASLTAFMEKIITTYTKRPVKYTRCGYACSDHASWSRAGYTTAMPAEARFEDTNPVMHSSEDTIDKLDIEHMTDYAKIATAFAVELAEPTA